MKISNACSNKWLKNLENDIAVEYKSESVIKRTQDDIQVIGDEDVEWIKEYMPDMIIDLFQG